MQFTSGDWADVPSVQSVPVPEPINKKLSVVLPFIEKEIPNVLDLLNQSYAIAGQIQRQIFLVPFKGLKIDDIKEHAQRAFASVDVIQDGEGKVSDWQGREQIRDGSGPNSLFRQAAWFFYLNKRFGSWLWLEPDCWPITERWLYDLEQEYWDVGKPFMGVRMSIGTQRNYMNGVGIYPWNAVQFAPLLVQSTNWSQHPEIEVGFDVAGGDQVLKFAHITRKIQLLNHLSESKADVREGVSLCHGRPDLSGGVESRHASQGRIEPHPTKHGEQTGILCADGASLVACDSGSSVPPAQQIDGTGPGQGKTDTGPSAILEPVPSQSSQRLDSTGYGSISKDIRFHVSELARLWDEQPHRKVLIVKELRNAKLVPKHFR